MVYQTTPRDIAVLAGGFVQGRFSSMGGASGLDLHIVTDAEGIHGKYEGHDFSLTISEQMHTLEFRFEMKVPASKELPRQHYPNLSRIIGNTTIEVQQGSYSARGFIRKHPQQIKSANDVLSDLWNYIMKGPFSMIHREKFAPKGF